MMHDTTIWDGLSARDVFASLPESNDAPVISAPRVFRDAQGDLWLDPGDGGLMALDEPVLRRLRDKWPQRQASDIEEEFGRLTELITPAIEYGVAARLKYSVVTYGPGRYAYYAFNDRSHAEEELAAFADSGTWDVMLIQRTTSTTPGDWEEVRDSH